MDITIRRAHPADADSVLRLLGQIARYHQQGRPDIFRVAENQTKYSKEEFKEMLNDGNTSIFVAADRENRIVGYAFCLRRAQGGHRHPVLREYASLFIDDFCVEETLRGQQIGKKIFAVVQEYAKEIGARAIELNVWEFNHSAIRFYEACGFQTQKRGMELILE